jgi:hypothetical protein
MVRNSAFARHNIMLEDLSLSMVSNSKFWRNNKDAVGIICTVRSRLSLLSEK